MRKQFGLVFRWMLVVGALGVCAGVQAIQQEAPPTIEPLRFASDIQAFEARDKESRPPVGAVVVTGSSSVRRWHPTIERDLAPLTIIPRGFGGSTMEDALYWIDRVAIAYKPRAVVVYEGDNDTGRYEVPPSTIVAQFEAIVEKIHRVLPETRIYVISVKPSVSRWSTWPEAVATNDRLRAVAEKNDLVTYVDVASPMLRPDGSVLTDIFVEDDLHLNPKGYEIWSAAVRAVLVPAEGKHEGTE